MSAAGGLKPTLVHLGDKDRAAIERIKARLELDSSALCVRVALRDLARRLEGGQTLQSKQLPDQDQPAKEV